ncbi:VOC family protein [Georgenia yuyongxinii]|uniref:VOC family protein n=1 Tax=Georgenia yuyongxinii TaxID=2589797 RepID=A0A552WSR6_9MICO|nr:VOC family protein [Georgenia yuyongxinii]TRW45891.1 VOC family protein [Georgenia yuyongxinii]
MNLQFRGLTLEAGDRFDETAALYRTILGEPKFLDDGAWAPFAAADGVTLNVAGPREATGFGLLVSLKTDDLEAAVATLAEAGATLVQPITTGGHQRHAVLRDPAGVHLAVYSPLPA